jgi:hypothetical protein
MDLTYLSVGLVEELHRALRMGRPVDAAVSGLRRASLPGILEYGCLRRSLDSPPVPSLPESITSSLLGLALREVRSQLGLRADGPPKAPPRRTDRRPIEFQTIDRPEDVLDRSWEEFLLRFEFSAKEVGFAPKVASGLQGAFHEMAANAVTHAKADLPALAGYEVRGGMALFSVVDAGIGVLASLRANPEYCHLSRHNEAIKLALRDGTSSIVGPERRGFGFRQVFKSLAAHWGHLRFRSGEACLQMDGTGLDADRGEVHFPPPLPGFQVTVCCRTAPPSS